MTRDFLLPVREAILTALKSNDALTALVPADRIYPPKTPTTPSWPFIRYGAASDLPWKSAGEDGQRILTAVHCFARATDDEPDGEDLAGRIKAAVAEQMDGPAGKGFSIELDGGFRAVAQVQGGRVIRDGDEADDWHGLVDLEVVVSA
jgi:uncharacterized protein DUF3168